MRTTTGQLTNARRAEFALRTLLVHRQYTGGDEDMEEIMTDLFANLLHLCDESGYDFEDALQQARHHHQVETTEENA